MTDDSLQFKKYQNNRFMRSILCLLALMTVILSSSAQNPQQEELPVLNEEHSEYIPGRWYWKEYNTSQYMDLSVTVGTTGIGLEVASPISKYLQLRAGFDYMPRFTAKLKFDVLIGGQPAHQYDEYGNPVESTFEKMQKLMKGFSGYDVEDHVDMIGKPKMINFKLLLDVFPFKANKNLYFTAGFYWGPSQFAIADNSTEAMTSLLSVGIYNRIYERAEKRYPLMEWEDMGIPEEVIDKYHLNFIPTELYEKIVGFGRLGFGLGTFTHDFVDENGVERKKGEVYYMEPDTDGMVHVNAKSNFFKPYVGFGYGGRLSKKRDDWRISFDAGVWFWGGSPKLYTHDGVDLVHDVEEIEGLEGQVGKYVDFFGAFKVYPVLNLKITKRLFY